jgi:hypothetical protein
MRFPKPSLTFGLCLGLLGLSLPSAWALKFNFATEPIRINARAGDTVNRTFWLTLSKDEKPTHFKAHMEDWWRSEDGKQSFYREPGTLAHSCAKWVKLNPVESEVAPGQTLNVKLSIAVPADVKPGGYWSVLTVDELPDPLSVPSGVGIRFVGSLSLGVFLNIGPLDKQAQIQDVKIDSRTAQLKLKNAGNCPFPVEGKFQFVDPGTGEVNATVALPRGMVLPEPIDTALFTLDLPDNKALPTGRYLVRVILDIGLDHFIGAQKELEITREEAPPTTGAPQG